ncbi:MAG TPA: long-chain fatty acid--CoA ligase [Candidatus Acidoferrum sp.]|nr:long-chain fatty acid--CoA ligase [Candidatus Acidoferrum sp.]
MTISIVEPTSKPPSKAAQTIPGVFFEQAARAGEREYLRFFRDGSWQALSWQETAERATRVACGLIAAGLEPGDHVALLSENRVEWLYCDLAILAAGGVTVPIYPSLTAHVAGYIAEDSKARLAIVSNAQLAEKLSGLDHPKHIFKMETDVVEWVQNAPGLEAERELASRLEALRPEAMATVVYTSGTTGDPKGVMLTHRHFVEMGKSALQAFHIGPEDRLLSYLPYSHVLERVDGIFIETMAGSSFWLARGMETLVEDIQAAKPTVMLGVPRVFEKVYEAVFDQVHNQPIYKRAIFRWALGIGAARLHREPGPWLGLRLRIADRLVLDSLRTRLTGGRLRFFISGGAPLNEKVEEFFWSIGVKILQGWGLTESTSGVTSNTEEDHRYRTVGKALPGMEIRIETDGEILVKGPAVMLGYKNRPEATAEMIGDGWLKTGDMGFVDADGFLTITDRKKDLLKTSGGKYIAPLPIESQLENDRYVKASLVVGDQRPFVVALIVPDWEALRADTGLQGDPAALVIDPALIARFSKTVDEVNTGLASFESVKYFALTDRDFTEAEGELTPTLKKKRRVIVEHFAGQIEAMYASHTR